MGNERMTTTGAEAARHTARMQFDQPVVQEPLSRERVVSFETLAGQITSLSFYFLFYFYKQGSEQKRATGVLVFAVFRRHALACSGGLEERPQ